MKKITLDLHTGIFFNLTIESKCTKLGLQLSRVALSQSFYDAMGKEILAVCRSVRMSQIKDVVDLTKVPQL